MPVPVRIPTLDEIQLSGCLYSSASIGPGIVMVPGFGCVKEMLLPEIAEAFANEGITALTLDPRCTGSSDGLPRQDIDPKKQVADFSDALTFLAKQPNVDRQRLAFWGFSFGGAVCLNAAALDKRARGVIAVAPLTDFLFEGTRSKLLAKAMKDRVSQLQENPPFMLPILNEDGKSPVHFGAIKTTRRDYELLVEPALKHIPTYRNETTLQTYYHIINWSPYALVDQIAPSSVLHIVPADDNVSPVDKQHALFERIAGPKQQHVEPGSGHMDVLSGDSFPRLVEMQVKFLQSL